ncbi:hypothetical protein KVV02_006559 [Mortierella alpina]|uniref:Uncharacterized protein n=1 Tax=Mortierella alpina TaxID=64518 RepID=A0A9P8A011_MORAP|nr:hypothetical protein KVV02_006559 [Mortierella alpina]
MSDDFPFTFGDTSDEDEGSAGLFCAPKTKNSTRIRAPGEQEPYHAQIDEDGWFHHTGKSVRELMMQDKNGANKVKMRADHYYMLRRYQEAYEIAKAYCEIVASNDVRAVQGDGGLSRSSTIADAEAVGVLKVTDSKELQEMAIRCALKLGKTDEAAKLVDELTLQDTGVVFLKARAYMAAGRYNDACVCLVQYQKTRSSNYSIWRCLAECLHQFASQAEGPSSPPSIIPTTTSPTPKKQIVRILSLISVLRAIHLMRCSTWSPAPYAQARFSRELTILEDLRLELQRCCGINPVRTLDEGGAATDRAAQDAAAQSRLEEYQQKVVLPAQDTLRMLRGDAAGVSHCPVEQEVVEYIVAAWDTQLIAPSPTGAAEDDEDQDEPRARNK